MSQLLMFEGLILDNVHEWWDCQGMDYDPPKHRACVIHRPTPHHMRLWSLIWRGDRGIFERLCPHGIGHPDPDQFDYWKECGREWESVHGCDGCCVQGPLLKREGPWPTRSSDTATPASASNGFTWELANTVASLN